MMRSTAIWQAKKSRPHLVWENVKGQVEQTAEGYLVFDDTVVDKNFSFKMELVRRQWSGDAHGIIKGIGVVTCVYVNPTLDQFWIIDYRIYDPEGDGKTKLDHVHDMLTNCVYHKHLLFRSVLMDSWYATKETMLFIEQLNKVYYCPLKDNRQVDDSGGCCALSASGWLAWSEAERQHGKVVKIKGFPKDHKVKLFRVVLSPQRTDYVVTNDFAQDNTQAVQEVCGLRWKIEQFHRETKQLTGLEGCQCRKARIIRNHIGCAILVWVRLKQVAYETQPDYLPGQTWFVIRLFAPAVEITNRHYASCVSPNMFTDVRSGRKNNMRPDINGTLNSRGVVCYAISFRPKPLDR